MRIAPQDLDPDNVALFLDVDGTLLDIRDHPADVSADDKLVDLLERCRHRLDGAMALISGRSVKEIDRIFAPAVFPVAGAHGSERRSHDGRVISAGSQPLPERAIDRLEALVAQHSGLLLEHKEGGVSLHYRRAPELEQECRRAIEAVLAGLGDAFRLIAGKMVFEIAPAAHDKGAAIRAFLEEPPFAGRVAVFVGDDVTDEDGFLAVNELHGVSIRIGDIEHSEAQYCLPDTAAVRPWLVGAILAGEPRQGYGGSHL
jgi:trehalose 6-phosphate phosphatase